MEKQSTIIIVCVAVAAVIGAAFALYIMTSSDDDESFKVTYYKNEKKLLERTVPAGTSITVYDDMGDGDGLERFIGWNTKPDMTGKMLFPLSQMTVKGNISLYAVMVGSGVFVIMLPDEQAGYSITADPIIVARGSGSILSYSLLPSHVDDELVIAVNGNPMKLDAMKRIHLTNITEDQIVTVSGVFDKREHSITLPDDQRGYVLRSSAERVHHGESYTLEYTLLPGYRETYGFGIRLNGGNARMPLDGILLIEDVRDNHTITVTGVEPIQYSMTAGKNTSVIVNGVPASKATVEDLVEIMLNEGYTMPDTFPSQIKGEFTAEDGGYRITSNVVFPSVLKITAGDNVRINGRTLDAIFLCPADMIRVAPAAGYTLPEDYVEKTKSLNGAKYSAGEFSFSNDAELPSIYRVVFNGYSKVHKTLYVTGETITPTPENPNREGYFFNGWDTDLTQYVISNLSISPIWGSYTFDVKFGPNLIIKVGNRLYPPSEETNEPFITIKIKSDEEVVIKNVFGLPLPDDFGPQIGRACNHGEFYEILGKCTFPGITSIKYVEIDFESGPACSATIGRTYTLPITPTENKEGFYFNGWKCNNEYVNQIEVENKAYVIYAEWKPIGG